MGGTRKIPHFLSQKKAMRLFLMCTVSQIHFEFSVCDFMSMSVMHLGFRFHCMLFVAFYFSMFAKTWRIDSRRAILSRP